MTDTALLALNLSELTQYLGTPSRDATDLILTDQVSYTVRVRSTSSHVFGTRDPKEFLAQVRELVPGSYSVQVRSLRPRRVVHSHPLTIDANPPGPETLEDRVARLETFLAIVVGVLHRQQTQSPEVPSC